MRRVLIDVYTEPLFGTRFIFQIWLAKYFNKWNFYIGFVDSHIHPRKGLYDL